MAVWRAPSGLTVTKWFLGLWTLAVFVFLYAPILLLMVFSFNDSRFNVTWKGFTTRWYAELFQNSTMLEAFKKSLVIAICTTVLATVLGTLGSWLLHRYRYPAQRVIALLTFIPMVIPEVLMGVSLLLLFVQFLHLELGYLSVIISHTTFCFPFVMVGITARLQGIDPALEEAALDLGAKPWQAFWLVILPYLTPAIVSGALMSFTLSMDEYLVTVFVAGDAQTLPLKVYGIVKKGLDPQINALSTIFVLATVILVVFSEMLKPKPAR